MPSKSDIVLKTKLADLQRMRDTPTTEVDHVKLATALRDRINLVVAAAAEIVGEWQLSPLEVDLVTAYTRLAIDGVRRDPTCAGKIAIVEALREMDYADSEFWLAGIGYRQLEPAYGPPVDTGARIRALSAVALARSGYPDALLDLAPLLQDPALDARIGAIQAVATTMQPGAAALIWHKMLVGDAEPEPYYEGFAALLVLIPERALPFIASFLSHDRPGVPEVAALALGESRRPEVLPYLQEALEEADDPALRRSLPLAMALLRTNAANDALMQLLREGSSFDADAAMKALEVVRPDEALWREAQDTYANRSRR